MDKTASDKRASVDRVCPDCGSERFSIDWAVRNTGSAPDGRLRLNEIDCVIFSSCDDCCATVFTMTIDDYLRLLKILEKASEQQLAMVTDLQNRIDKLQQKIKQMEGDGYCTAAEALEDWWQQCNIQGEAVMTGTEMTSLCDQFHAYGKTYEPAGGLTDQQITARWEKWFTSDFVDLELVLTDADLDAPRGWTLAAFKAALTPTDSAQSAEGLTYEQTDYERLCSVPYWVLRDLLEAANSTSICLGIGAADITRAALTATDSGEGE